MDNRDNPWVVWCVSDAKPGHENQTRGLVEALADLVPVDDHWLPALPRGRALRCWLGRRFPAGATLPDPDLVIGAGSATHLTLLAARRARGGRSVVLMKPGLPRRLFDLCVIPEHDGVPPSSRVLVTCGVLNRIRPSTGKDPYKGLILIGGPSKHHRWDDTSILVQVREITAETRIHWTVATSRRTPVSMLAELRDYQTGNITVVPWQETGPDWLPRQLADAFRVWISEDSVSMVYEALTSGAHCGLLEVPPRHPHRHDRVRRGLQKLIDTSLIVTFSQWELTGRLGEIWDGPSEAQRVARWMVETWGMNRHG